MGPGFGRRGLAWFLHLSRVILPVLRTIKTSKNIIWSLIVRPCKTGWKKASIAPSSSPVQSITLATWLTNRPINLTPTDLAGAAAEIARNNNLPVRIIEKEEMRSLGMGGILAVSQGSVQPPKFIIIPSTRAALLTGIDLALIGKGITFDSGGISLKPSDNMGEMKGDMAGGADVIAAIGAIAQLKIPLNVSAFIPATENMPSGNALKPPVMSLPS